MALLQIRKAKTRDVLSVLRKELTEPLIIFAKHFIVEVSQSCEYIYKTLCPIEPWKTKNVLQSQSFKRNFSSNLVSVL